MDRATIINAAGTAVMVDREATHGNPENSFGVIAALWSTYLHVPLAPHDVAAMMILFKIARIRGNPTHADSWVDVAGYAACGGEIATGDKDAGR